MFMVSVKLSRKRIAICVLVSALALSTGLLISSLTNDTVKTSSTKASNAETTKKEKDDKSAKASDKEKPVVIKKKTMKTNPQRLQFIEGLGWQVHTEPVEVIEVIIPKEFDEVYSDYNAIQKLQGFDMKDYAGKRCKRYSYEIVNYPGQTEPVRINLLICGNKLVGGDVATLADGGFMHGFLPPEK